MIRDRLLFKLLLLIVLIFSINDLLAQNTIQTGSTAPSVQMSDMANGQNFSIRKFKGKVILLNFVSGWCPSCIKAQKEIVDLTDKYRGLQTITISLDRDSSGFADSLEKEKLDLHFVFDDDSRISLAFGVPLLPTIYIIDQYGKIRYILPGYKPEGLKKLEFFLRGLVD